MKIDRRQTFRAKQTAASLWARWVRMSVMRRVVVTLLTAAAIGGTTFAACSPDSITGPEESSVTPRMPRASVVINEQRIPFRTLPRSNPCAPNDGLIAFSGYMHTVITATTDVNGGVHLQVQVTETSLTGVSMVNGKVYRASSELHQSTNDRGPAPLTMTMIDNFRIIGPEPEDNFFMYVRTHLTVNANSVPTAEVERAEPECR